MDEVVKRLGPYPEDQPRYGEHLRAMLSRALEETPVHKSEMFGEFLSPDSLGRIGRLYDGEPCAPSPIEGMRVVTRSDMPPGTAFLVADSVADQGGVWEGTGPPTPGTRVVKISVESLNEAITRESDKSDTAAADAFRRTADKMWSSARQWKRIDPLSPWLLDGIALLDRMRVAGIPVEGARWFLPPELIGEDDGFPMYLCGHPVSVLPGVAPHLAFGLEVS